jgi:hypothetical protein
MLIHILNNVTHEPQRSFLGEEIKDGHCGVHIDGMEVQPSYYVGYLGGFPEGISPSQMIILIDHRSNDHQPVPDGALSINHFGFFLVERPTTKLSLWLSEKQETLLK